MDRVPLSLRLFVTLAVTLLVSGGFAILVGRPATRTALLDQAGKRHDADAKAIEASFHAVGPGERAEDEVAEAIDVIGAGPQTLYSWVADERGVVIASTKRAKLGERYVGGDIRRALAGRSVVHLKEGPTDSHIALYSPLTLDGKTHVLHSDHSLAELRAGEAVARDQALLAMLVGLLAAVPLFFLLGGRSIGRAHRTALHRAERDGLTDLPNHRAFQAEIERAVQAADRGAGPVAVAMLDIDDFKTANDQLGHRHGDRLLCQVAASAAGLRGSDRAFRLGGDEFAVILGCTDETGAARALDRLRGDLASRLHGTTVSIGFAVHRQTGRSAEALWESADAALYEAKRSGGDRVRHADGEGTTSADERRALATLLGSEPAIALQPIVTIDDRRPIGYEALARPSVGFANPGDAFAAAERHGKSTELDTLCRDRALLRGSAIPDDALLFLNVSPASLDGDALAGDTLVLDAAVAGLRPENIVLEITERSVARLDRVIAEAVRLRALGFKLALDDVGAGNAGLEMLRLITVDFVKVDRGVVHEAMHSRRARGVLAAIFAFAEQSGAAVIVEGIEDEAMLERVCAIGDAGPGRPPRVHAAQGFHLGRPEVASEDPASAPA